ncbi:hypothetical protein [Clostridium beijerinckii]|nr:hypothetical protein [Clostridium beijerinckii]NRT73624.1 hypothetical protein [Clostridium beijerinckii]
MNTSLILSIISGIVQLFDCSISDKIHIKTVLQFLKVAVIFTIIGYNLPK